MKTLSLALTVLAAAAVPAQAQNARFEQSLRLLDPDTRFDQVCDVAAMNAIRRDTKQFRPDRAMSSAISNTRVKGDTMEGTGGAFRSKGIWYQFSFTCTVTPDRMKVLSFSYKTGEAIPESKWANYGLWR